MPLVALDCNAREGIDAEEQTRSGEEYDKSHFAPKVGVDDAGCDEEQKRNRHVATEDG